jgi:uncharacterized protein
MVAFLDILLTLVGAGFIVAGIVGCFLPVIPGPPFSFLGLFVLHLTSFVQFEAKFLWIIAGVTILVTLIDYWIPVWGTRRFGGTSRGSWGSLLGMIVGIFLFPPFGIIVGAFAGAVVGELTGGNDTRSALRSGIGALVGFLAGTALKLGVSGVITFYFVKGLIAGL